MSDSRDNLNTTPVAAIAHYDAARLIKHLGSKDVQLRVMAERDLRAMGSAAIEPMLLAVVEELRSRGRWQLFCAALIGIVVAVDIIKAIEHGLFSVNPAGLASILLFFLRLPGATTRQRSLVHILADINDPRAVGPLADALAFTDSSDWEARKVAKASLIRILPQLRSSDAHMLNGTQRKQLGGALSGRDKPLILATLKALEQVGDERDLPFVEKVCSADREVMEAAKACLLFLRIRTEQKKVSNTLLRASSPNSATPDMLLRPATGKRPTEPQTLLRAGCAQDECLP